MESDNLTEKSLDEAKKKTTDKEIEKVLASAKETLENNNDTVKKSAAVEKDSATKKAGVSEKESAAALDFAEDVYVDNGASKEDISKYKLTVGDIIGGFFEFLWTLFKLAVVVSIVTGIVGFFLSREMMIRGRNGSLQCISDMKPSQTVLTNKGSEDDRVSEWLSQVDREKITMESDDGYILIARKIMVEGAGNKWAVILHGYNGSMEDIYDIAMHYNQNGYNVLMPDLRASGESEASFIGMGWLDRLDVINWIDVILDEEPLAEIVVHGVDMGADAALMLSGEPIKSNIRVIIADGAYTSAWDVMKKEYQVRHEEWPVFPVFNMLNPVAKIWGGYSLKEADAVTSVKKTSVPILLIHGGQDTYVTDDMINEIDGNIASAHELVIIASGMHDDCRYADPDTYYNKTFDFVNAHISE